MQRQHDKSIVGVEKLFVNCREKRRSWWWENVEQRNLLHRLQIVKMQTIALRKKMLIQSQFDKSILGASKLFASCQAKESNYVTRTLLLNYIITSWEVHDYGSFPIYQCSIEYLNLLEGSFLCTWYCFLLWQRKNYHGKIKRHTR